MLLQLGFELLNPLFHSGKFLDNFLIRLRTRGSCRLVGRSGTVGRGGCGTLLTVKGKRQQRRGGYDESRPFASFYCRLAVVGIHNYQFSTLLYWIEFREVSLHRLRGQSLPFLQNHACTPQCQDQLHSDPPALSCREDASETIPPLPA